MSTDFSREDKEAPAIHEVAKRRSGDRERRILLLYYVPIEYLESRIDLHLYK